MTKIFGALGVSAILCACANPGPAADPAERFARHCESLGHARGSEAFRACIETEEINAALATQRDYDRKLLRRADCVDPRIACDTAR